LDTPLFKSEFSAKYNFNSLLGAANAGDGNLNGAILQMAKTCILKENSSVLWFIGLGEIGKILQCHIVRIDVMVMNGRNIQSTR
jgi:hypothetical protein